MRAIAFVGRRRRGIDGRADALLGLGRLAGLGHGFAIVCENKQLRRNNAKWRPNSFQLNQHQADRGGGGGGGGGGGDCWLRSLGRLVGLAGMAPCVSSRNENPDTSRAERRRGLALENFWEVGRLSELILKFQI